MSASVPASTVASATDHDTQGVSPGQALDKGSPKRAYNPSSPHPRGSTAWSRGEVLAALAVVKLATPAQLRRLLPTPRGDKAVRNALNDLARHRLATSDGRKIRRLTPAGQRAPSPCCQRAPPRGDRRGRRTHRRPTRHHLDPAGRWWPGFPSGYRA
ncbi:hypothetical protein ABIA38_009038 [Embleya sp. AB8]